MSNTNTETLKVNHVHNNAAQAKEEDMNKYVVDDNQGGTEFYLS